MTTHVVTDDVLAMYAKREWELRRRLMEGTLDPSKVCAGLQTVIENSSWPMFLVWKRIKVGTGLKTADDFRRDLNKHGCKVNVSTCSMLSHPKFVVASTEEDIELCSATVAELGFSKTTRYDAICARIIELGYTLCEPEDGPQLRRQYLDQPLGEWRRMAMKAIRDSCGSPDVFNVGHDESGLWLRRHYGGPDYLHCPVDPFVFRLRKRPLAA